MRILIFQIAILSLLAGLAVSARAQAFQCTVSGGAPAVVRAEGTAEPVGDFLMTCTGGLPTPAGMLYPQANFILTLNANLTSELTSTSQFNEALLIVDEPASAVEPDRPILNCGNSGAPDNGGPGAGVCDSVSSGYPAMSYDGTPNGYESNLCDGAAGRPTPNSYTCGRPNVFQGRLGTPQNPGQLNAITFLGVPLDPPGTVTNRTFRITNLRVNAASIGAASGFSPNPVDAVIAVTGSASPSISNPQQTMAYVETSLFLGSGCKSSPSCVG
jgi:hypothetical protein